MMLTTKSRYAVMAMVDIATQTVTEKPVRLAEIANRQGIALNYLEQIFNALKSAGLVTSVKGPGGGYLISRDIKDVSVADIVNAVDESTEMTRCASGEKKTGCMKDNSKCLTHDIWEGLTTQINNYLSGITLSSITEKGKVRDFISQ